MSAKRFRAERATSDGQAASAEADGLAGRLLPHLASAYNLARWLVEDGEDAEDVVQEAYLRALQQSSGFRGGDPREWLLAIVSNTAYGWLRKTGAPQPAALFDEDIHDTGVEKTLPPEQLLLLDADERVVARALSELPVRFREILVLRELEDLSYKEISDVMGVPIATVMSTLSRARDRFRRAAGDLLKAHLSAGDGPTVQGPECVETGVWK